MSNNHKKIMKAIALLGFTLSLGANASSIEKMNKSALIKEMGAMKLKVSSMSSELLSDLTTEKTVKGVIVHERSKEKPADMNMWAHLDSRKDGIEGTSTARLYKKKGSKIAKNAQEIIVAVIDSGVDINHQDLQGKIWTNEAEVNGIPGKDDDGNGYIDDVHGWNFLGNKDGTNVVANSLEMTREFSRLSKKKATTGLTPDEEKYFAVVSKDYLTRKKANLNKLKESNSMLNIYELSIEILKLAGLKKVNFNDVDGATKALKDFETLDELTMTAKEVLLSMLSRKITKGALEGRIAYYEAGEDFYYNPDLNASEVIGDNPNKMDDIGYGNNDVIAEGADHGTHVSGIIAAVRDNGMGMDGQSLNVKIMPVRAVPDGDERDKDVANAIRYAVNNGARVINMSFGKGYSPNKDYVDAAVKYAQDMGVLLVHAAGNDGQNTEAASNFPTKKYIKGTMTAASNFIEVGASAPKKGLELPAYFSNYGKTTVDLFAPGFKIYSTVPGNEYAAFSGTSMASPEVAGVAALVLSMNPGLAAQEVKNILMNTVTPYDGLTVGRPMSDDEEKDAKSNPDKYPVKVPFSDLSVTGGIVNALKAVKAAI